MRISKKIMIYGILIIIFLALSILTFIFFMNKKIYNNSITVAKMEIVGDEGIVSKLDVSFITGKIATRGEDSFYLAGDENNIYIISTRNELPDELEKIKEYSYLVTDIKPKSYEIIGVSYEIESELKNIALKAYNELFPNQKLDSQNFEDYFGEYYLNIEEVYDKKESMLFIFFVISSVITAALVIIMILSYKKK